MIFTHTGLMGDFVQTWPIASWYYKQTGEKITFVLALRLVTLVAV